MESPKSFRRPFTRSKEPTEKVVQDIRRATRKHHSAEEKIRIVLSEAWVYRMLKAHVLITRLSS